MSNKQPQHTMTLTTRTIGDHVFEIGYTEDGPKFQDIARPHYLKWQNSHGTQVVYMPTYAGIEQVLTRYENDLCSHAWDVLARDTWGDLNIEVEYHGRYSDSPDEPVLDRWIGKWGGPNPGMIYANSYSQARSDANWESVIAAQKAA